MSRQVQVSLTRELAAKRADMAPVRKLGILSAFTDVEEMVMRPLRAPFWRWYEGNKELEVLHVRVVWLFTAAVKVGQLEPLFRLLFGDPPGGAQ